MRRPPPLWFCSVPYHRTVSQPQVAAWRFPTQVVPPMLVPFLVCVPCFHPLPERVPVFCSCKAERASKACFLPEHFEVRVFPCERPCSCACSDEWVLISLATATCCACSPLHALLKFDHVKRRCRCTLLRLAVATFSTDVLTPGHASYRTTWGPELSPAHQERHSVTRRVRRTVGSHDARRSSRRCRPR